MPFATEQNSSIGKQKNPLALSEGWKARANGYPACSSSRIKTNAPLLAKGRRGCAHGHWAFGPKMHSDEDRRFGLRLGGPC